MPPVLRNGVPITGDEFDSDAVDEEAREAFAQRRLLKRTLPVEAGHGTCSVQRVKGSKPPKHTPSFNGVNIK
jgi:hypothetical protein